jgi:hypothetical protein
MGLACGSYCTSLNDIVLYPNVIKLRKIPQRATVYPHLLIIIMNKRKCHFERTCEGMCRRGEEKSYTSSSKPCKTVVHGV